MMTDIDDIWSDDEFAEYERSKMDPRERYLADMRRVARTQDPRGCDSGRKIEPRFDDDGEDSQAFRTGEGQ